MSYAVPIQISGPFWQESRLMRSSPGTPGSATRAPRPVTRIAISASLSAARRPCLGSVVAREEPVRHLEKEGRRCRATSIGKNRLWPSSFRACLQRDQSLARRSARAPLRIHFHAQSRLLAQSRRGLLFQTRPLRPAPHPRRIQAEAQGSPHGRGQLFQPRSRSFTHGPTSSTRPDDMIRTSKPLV